MSVFFSQRKRICMQTINNDKVVKQYWSNDGPVTRKIIMAHVQEPILSLISIYKSP